MQGAELLIDFCEARQGKAREKVFGTGPARYATPATTEMGMTATATTAECCHCNFSFFVKAQGSQTVCLSPAAEGNRS